MHPLIPPRLLIWWECRRWLLLFCGMCALDSFGAVFNVNTTTDTDAVSASAGTGIDSNGKVSLRSALEAADALGGTHTVNLPAGSYNLIKGSITFGNTAQNITINGGGAAVTIVNMTTTLQNRIFLINPPGTNLNVVTSINNVQFTGGKLTGDTYGGGAMIAGGPGNSLTLTNCIFQNNSISAGAGGGGGGAVRYNSGGSLAISGCVFNNNSNPASVGGAVSYFLENLTGVGNGAVSITNSTFTGNSVTASGASGGAIDVGAQGRITTGVTFTVSILRNTLSGNSASGTSGTGGAISITNSFDVGNVAQIHYNRIFSNTSTAAPNGLAMSSAQGGVDATDNWWGINTGPGTSAAITGSGGVGTLAKTTWLQLRHSASPNPIATGGTTTLTADILGRNSGGPISATSLTGLPAFPASATTIFSDATNGILSNAATQFLNGQATAIFTAGSTSGTGSANASLDNQTAVTASLTINQPPTMTSLNSATFTTGIPGSFTVTATGAPAPTFGQTGALPSGVTLSAGGVLSGTPAAGTGGNYPITITVSNGVGTNATQNFILTVNQPPAITSANTVLFTVGSNGTFNVAATGFPSPIFGETGALPGGVTLSASGVLSGTPATGTGGTYPITMTASNGTGSDAAQNFSLVINTPPIPGADTFGTLRNSSFSTPLTQLLLNDSDPDGDSISITGINSPSTRGGTISTSGSNIIYTPPNNYSGPDTFTYVLRDGRGATTTGLVTVNIGLGAALGVTSITRSDSEVVISGLGIPGNSYIVQSATAMNVPFTDLSGPITAGVDGSFNYRDITTTQPSQKFYRVRSNP